MKNKKMSASMEAMREIGKNGGLKSFMNGGDVTDSLIKAQVGREMRSDFANYRAKERAKDSVNTRNKLTDEYWDSQRGNPLKNRNGWFGEGNTTDPDMKKYVEKGMAKKGYGSKPSKMASKGYYGDTMKKLSKKKK